MVRERSAGGVVVREHDGVLEVAVIQPRGREAVALPKGHVDPGESPEQAAQREVTEETGLTVTPAGSLGEIHYMYRFRGQLISKSVAFFLFRWAGGEIGEVAPEMRIEVARAWWLPLSRAPSTLSYRGERQAAQKAIEVLGEANKVPGSG
ncbi:MAG: NUDIX hydrolase, partial [Myxococcaceae bacterium]